MTFIRIPGRRATRPRPSPTDIARAAFTGLLLAAFAIAPAAAQKSPGDPAQGGGSATEATRQAAPAPVRGGGHDARPAVTAARALGAITLDGRLSEEAWAQAEPAGEFTQLDPLEGTPASERTEVRVLYDDGAVYVGARLHDSRRPSAPLGRHDMTADNSDWFAVILDSNHDHRSAFRFGVNPAGVRYDALVTDGGEDASWDPVWEAAVRTDSGGWTVEYRIPLGQLRFSAAPEQTWGIQLQRVIASRNETAFLAFTPKSERAGISAYGHLRGLRRLGSGNRLEIRPYTLARASQTDPGSNPFRGRAQQSMAAGVDLKYRITPQLTVDATLNPDFGQVEADPAQVNLSAFESFFSERRPFFVEGANIFAFAPTQANGPGSQFRNMLYTRRVGRQPQLDAPTGQADVPGTTTILGAAKLSGRIGGWSVGALQALTDRENARYRGDDGDGRAAVEPFTSYTVARATREMAGGTRAAGLMGTAVHRDLSSGDLRSTLRSDAYTGGVDFFQEWGGRAWRLSGFAVGSHVRGSRESILATQRSSAHYFQRPDATHLEVDPTATSLSGYALRVQLERLAGRHWTGDAAISAASPGLELNDMGFMPFTDMATANAQVRYRENRPGRVLRSYAMNAYAVSNVNFAGQLVGNRLFLGTQWQLLNYWSVVANLGYTMPHFDDRLTRGGPLARRGGHGGWLVDVASDPRRRVSTSFRVYHEPLPDGGWDLSTSASLTLRPSPRWNFRVEPRLVAGRNVAQFVTSREDPLAEETFGRRYVFAAVEQRALSMATRLNYTFTPRMSLELYAEPFIASGDYGKPKEFLRPRGFRFGEYGKDVGTVREVDGDYRVDPDGEGPANAFTVEDRSFNTRSLRGNAILRWEWRQGSTLFLVWQQARTNDDAIGNFDLRRDRTALFDTRPQNVFVIKATYWLNP